MPDCGKPHTDQNQNLPVGLPLLDGPQHDSQSLPQKKSREHVYIASQLSHTDVASDNVTDIQIDLETIMNALPKKLRIAFILSRFEGLKNSEIAEILNVSIKTVESRITKVLKTLREILTSK